MELTDIIGINKDFYEKAEEGDLWYREDRDVYFLVVQKIVAEDGIQLFGRLGRKYDCIPSKDRYIVYDGICFGATTGVESYFEKYLDFAISHPNSTSKPSDYKKVGSIKDYIGIIKFFIGSKMCTSNLILSNINTGDFDGVLSEIHKLRDMLTKDESCLAEIINRADK